MCVCLCVTGQKKVSHSEFIFKALPRVTREFQCVCVFRIRIQLTIYIDKHTAYWHKWWSMWIVWSWNVGMLERKINRKKTKNWIRIKQNHSSWNEWIQILKDGRWWAKKRKKNSNMIYICAKCLFDDWF